MKFCSECGSTISQKIPPGDERERYVCEQCGTIHYQNPNIVAGCIVEKGDQILLCKRAIEPRSGLWTLPAGFMENGESTQQAAARETWEEAKAKVDNLHLYTLFNLPHINQVYMMFRGQLIGNDYAPGIESLEVALYDEKDIPWDDLAFPVIEKTLALYYEDKKQGRYPFHLGDIVKVSEQPRKYRFDMLINKET